MHFAGVEAELCKECEVKSGVVRDHFGPGEWTPERPGVHSESINQVTEATAVDRVAIQAQQPHPARSRVETGRLAVQADQPGLGNRASDGR